jgi:redox-sensitive bicupin YhaK (pirin superfamily)
LEEPEFLENKAFHGINVTPQSKQYVFNPSQTEAAHIFQSGFNPSASDLVPVGKKKLFTHAERLGALKLIASPDGRNASLPIQQDVFIYSTCIQKGNHVIHEIGAGRSAWLHVVNGQIQLNDLLLKMGDGVGLKDEMSISFTALGPSEILLFDLCEQVPETTQSDPEQRYQAVDPGLSSALNANARNN